MLSKLIERERLGYVPQGLTLSKPLHQLVPLVARDEPVLIRVVGHKNRRSIGQLLIRQLLASFVVEV